MHSFSLGIALSNLTSLSTQLTFFLMVKSNQSVLLALTKQLCLQSYSQIENGSISLRRIHEMATLQPERDSQATDIVVPSKKGMWPAKGSIVFEEFSMKYRCVPWDDYSS